MCKFKSPSKKKRYLDWESIHSFTVRKETILEEVGDNQKIYKLNLLQKLQVEEVVKKKLLLKKLKSQLKTGKKTVQKW